ncbi:unnamed protein product [Gadus morhua 'NCC']
MAPLASRGRSQSRGVSVVPTLTPLSLHYLRCAGQAVTSMKQGPEVRGPRSDKHPTPRPRAGGSGPQDPPGAPRGQERSEERPNDIPNNEKHNEERERVGALGRAVPHLALFPLMSFEEPPSERRPRDAERLKTTDMGEARGRLGATGTSSDVMEDWAAAGSYWDQFRRPGGLGGCWELLVRRYDGNVQNMIKAPLSEGRRGLSLRETPPSSMWRSNYA